MSSSSNHDDHAGAVGTDEVPGSFPSGAVDDDPGLKLACRLEVLPGDTARHRIDNAAAFGFEGVALPGRMKSLWLEELTHAGAGELALPLTSVSLGFEGTLVSPDAGVRQRCRDSLERLFDVCRQLGIGLVNLPPVLRQDHPQLTLAAGDHESCREWDRRLVEELAIVGTAAAGRGVRLLLEPVNRYESDYLHTLAHANRLCGEANQAAIGYTADLFHMQLEELSPERALWEGREWLGLVHVAENTRVEPGPGSMDFARCFAALRAIGYRGWVEIECRSLTGPAEQVLPRSAAHLREAWDEAGKLAGLWQGQQAKGA